MTYSEALGWVMLAECVLIGVGVFMAYFPILLPILLLAMITSVLAAVVHGIANSTGVT